MLHKIVEWSESEKERSKKRPGCFGGERSNIKKGILSANYYTWDSLAQSPTRRPKEYGDMTQHTAPLQHRQNEFLTMSSSRCLVGVSPKIAVRNRFFCAFAKQAGQSRAVRRDAPKMRKDGSGPRAEDKVRVRSNSGCQEIAVKEKKRLIAA